MWWGGGGARMKGKGKGGKIKGEKVARVWVISRFFLLGASQVVVRTRQAAWLPGSLYFQRHAYFVQWASGVGNVDKQFD